MLKLGLINRIKAYFHERRLKNCKHEFNAREVVNLNIDPACVHCGKKLSEFESGNNPSFHQKYGK